MTEAYATIVFLFVLFTLLGSSIWIGLALMGVAWVGMEMFTSRPAGDAMITTICACRKTCFVALHPGCVGYLAGYFTPTSRVVPFSPPYQAPRPPH